MKFSPGICAKLFGRARWELFTGKDAAEGYLRLNEERIPLIKITGVDYTPGPFWGMVELRGIGRQLLGTSSGRAKTIQKEVTGAIQICLARSFARKIETASCIEQKPGADQAGRHHLK
jgi:hypothetical protein